MHCTASLTALSWHRTKMVFALLQFYPTSAAHSRPHMQRKKFFAAHNRQKLAFVLRINPDKLYFGCHILFKFNFFHQFS
jgi:hypothetical protein